MHARSTRCGLVRRAAPAGLAFVFAAGLAAAPAAAGDGAFELAQLFGSSKKRTREAAEVSLRVDEVEQEIRNLTGKVEELSFQLRQLQDQIRRMQEDNEFRFQQLEGGGRTDRGDLTRPNRQSGLAAGTSPRVQSDGAAPNHVLGTLPQDLSSGTYQGSGDGAPDAGQGRAQGGGPIDLSALARGALPGIGGDEEPGDPAQDQDLPPPDNSAASGDPGQDYETAYNLILQGDYIGAESRLRSFMAAHPSHHLAGNAQYWLGESLFARGLYREAADAFLKSYSEYPQSSKGPDSLLKLGLALAGLGEQAAACATYGELLAKYPDAPASVKQRATVESKVIGCAS